MSSFPNKTIGICVIVSPNLRVPLPRRRESDLAMAEVAPAPATTSVGLDLMRCRAVFVASRISVEVASCAKSLEAGCNSDSVASLVAPAAPVYAAALATSPTAGCPESVLPAPLNVSLYLLRII